MRRDGPKCRQALAGLATLAMLAGLGGCGGAGDDGDDDTPSRSVTTTEPSASASSEPTPTTEPTRRRSEATAEAAAPPPSGLVYYAGRRARTGKLLLFAEQTGFTGRTYLLAAVRAAMAGPPVDPDYTALWGGDVVDRVRLHWDGDEGYYEVRLLADRATRRPPGMSMREAHLAIQQIVWTLHSVGGIPAPVRFSVARSQEPVTDLMGVPATGPFDSYPAAHYSGVLSSMNALTPANGAIVDGEVEVSGLAESFEATVGVRVLDPSGRLVVDDSTQAEQCCGALFPWSYTLDTSTWPPGAYTLSFQTDDPIGVAQGSDGPAIDTKTITIP